MENSDKSDKAFPRATQIAMGIFSLYLAFTVIWTFLLWWAGMSFFDAIAHAMTTIATGGFSTKDASIGYYDNPLIDVIITLGMTTGALPFLLYLQTLRGRPLSLFRDSQVRWFITIAVTIILSVAVWHSDVNDVGFWMALRFSSFNIISVMTGTGFATTDYGLWGAFAVAVFFFVMFIGGCAGSTTCGVKIFRLQVLYEIAKIQLNHMLRPHGVFIAYYNGKPLTEDVTESVLSFFFLFVFCFVVLAAGLGAMGLDFVTAISSAGTAIANVGPGLGPIVGPSGNFATLPDGAKWMMAAGMLIGRLEVFTVLILLSPDFWRD
jgi:trk system potassium uptake protein TrkH